MASDNTSSKLAVVTGASRGIGRAIALALADSGYDCLLVARSADALASVARDIASRTGRRIEPCAADLRTLPACEAVRDAAARLGSAEILVNCAGATRGGAFLDLDDAAWEDGFALKFYAAVRLSRLLWPALRQQRGTVVNIGGGAARMPDAGFMIGGAVNAALANFSKALADLGLRDDVNVCTVHPGMTATERLEGLLSAQASASGVSVDQLKQTQVEKSGTRRLGTADDVATLVRFLCSAEARHVNGVAVAVDGGALRALY